MTDPQIEAYGNRLAHMDFSNWKEVQWYLRGTGTVATSEECIKIVSLIREKMFTQEVKDYASAVHRLTCHHNHTDGCSWMYGEAARESEYSDTVKMLPQLQALGSPEWLHKVADLLRPGTENWK